MKSFVALLATTIALAASDQKQHFEIHKALDISEMLDVRQFNPAKGTLTFVGIQAQWTVATAGDYEIDLSLVCPGPSFVSESFTNTLTEDSYGTWGLGIGIAPADAGFASYVGNGTIPFTVEFTAISLSVPWADGDLSLTVVYTYEH